jgi:HIRAN domain-containing protein
MRENWISHVGEPDRLILAWQAPDEFKDRTRFAVGELTCEGDTVRLRYFEGAEFDALNPGHDYAKLLSYGYSGYPGFPPKEDEHTVGVLEAFMRRLPPRSRADFSDYERHLRIQRGISFSDFALLSLSEAYLPSDGFSVVDPLRPDVRQRELVLEVAGFRYYASKPGVSIPAPGDPVEIVPEIYNEYDPEAVAIMFEGLKIGNVNRLQAKTFRIWASQMRLNAVVDRINGRAERPRLLLFVRVEALKGQEQPAPSFAHA